MPMQVSSGCIRLVSLATLDDNKAGVTRLSEKGGGRPSTAPRAYHCLVTCPNGTSGSSPRQLRGRGCVQVEIADGTL